MKENAIDKQKALEIVKNHLLAGLKLHIDDRRSNDFDSVYGIESWPDDVWYVHMKWTPSQGQFFLKLRCIPFCF